MALFIVSSERFLELSLDGTTDFNSATDLVDLGMEKNAPDGMRVRKITFIPSAQGDTVVVRDGVGGPRVFSAVHVLGTWDLLKDEYFSNDKKVRGRIMTPFIESDECTVDTPNSAFLIFEL